MAKFRKSSITDCIEQSLLLQPLTNVTFGFRSAVVCALLLRGHRADRCQPVVQRRLQDDHRVVPRRLFPPHRHCHARLHRSFPVSSQSRVWVPPFEVGKWGKGLLQTFYRPTYLPTYLPTTPQLMDRSRILLSVTRKKSPKSYKWCPKMISHIYKNCLKMGEIWANYIWPKALKSCPKSYKCPNWSHWCW